MHKHSATELRQPAGEKNLQFCIYTVKGYCYATVSLSTDQNVIIIYQQTKQTTWSSVYQSTFSFLSHVYMNMHTTAITNPANELLNAQAVVTFSLTFLKYTHYYCRY